MLRREKCIFCGQKTWLPTTHFLVHLLEPFIPTERKTSSFTAAAGFLGQSSRSLEADAEKSKSAPYGAANTDGKRESRSRKFRKQKNVSARSLPKREADNLTSRRSDVLRWILECEHTIVCGCRHYVGEKVYCIKCGANQLVRGWKHFEAGRDSSSSGGSVSDAAMEAAHPGLSDGTETVR